MSGDGLEPGAIVEAEVEKGVFRGRGLARVDGRVVFVPHAHAGDRVRARITEVHAGWAEASLVEVLRPSPGRRASPCPYVPRCGGCAYQEYDSAAELVLKQAVLLESLARAGAPWHGAVAAHASPEAGWHMRASLHVERDDSGLRLGLRQEGSRRVVDVERCLQLSEAMNLAARAFHARLAGRPQLAARVHGLELFESPDGRALVATLETQLERAEAPQLASVGNGVAGLDRLRRPHARALARVAVRHALRGGERPRADSARARARVLPGQSLPARAARAHGGRARAARRLADPRPVRGRGPLHAAARRPRDTCETVAVEQSSQAAEDARVSAERHGLRVSVRVSDVERALAELPPRPGERIVLDPPRTGASRAIVEAIARRRPSRSSTSRATTDPSAAT